MLFSSKLSPEQWAEARRLHARGMPLDRIAEQFGLARSTIARRARREGWSGTPEGSDGAVPTATRGTAPNVTGSGATSTAAGIGTARSPRPARKAGGIRAAAAGKAKAGARFRPSVRTATGAGVLRQRLARRLYRLIDWKLKIMELRMQKQLQSQAAAADGSVPPAPTKDERETFAALVESINKVTEMVADPAPATAGRRRSERSVNPELAALSDDLDADGLAAASEKDSFRRELAEHLARMFPKP